MKKSKLDNKQLEEILRQFPSIHDHRHPHDIYRDLSLKMKKEADRNS